jgi:hypothetical protein
MVARHFAGTHHTTNAHFYCWPWVTFFVGNRHGRLLLRTWLQHAACRTCFTGWSAGRGVSQCSCQSTNPVPMDTGNNIIIIVIVGTGTAGHRGRATSFTTSWPPTVCAFLSFKCSFPTRFVSSCFCRKVQTLYVSLGIPSIGWKQLHPFSNHGSLFLFAVFLYPFLLLSGLFTPLYITLQMSHIHNNVHSNNNMNKNNSKNTKTAASSSSSSSSSTMTIVNRILGDAFLTSLLPRRAMARHFVIFYLHALDHLYGLVLLKVDGKNKIVISGSKKEKRNADTRINDSQWDMATLTFTCPYIVMYCPDCLLPTLLR